MNMLNKQIITIITVSFFWIAAAQIAFAKKPAGGGGGNHMQRGIELAQQKHFDAAVAEFTKAIEANPKDARGYANRGTAYRQGARTAIAAGDQEGASTRYQSALADFSKYVELAPKDASAYLERAATEIELKQYDAAVTDLNKALELKPDDINANKFRGFAELGLSQWDKAVADFTAVIQKKPDDLQNYDRRALAYRGLKNYEAALKINPQDNDTFQRLQYAQSMLAKRNASPPAAASPSPTPTPEKPSLISLINPLYVGIGIVALIIIAVIVRFLTRGKAEETSNIIR